MVTRVLVTLLVLTGVANAQAPAKITVGIYAPSVEFGTASARLAYVQGLAKAIEQNTGISTQADVYANLGALKKANPDFAIIEGQCYATNLGWKLHANANIGGSTSRTWALFASGADNMMGLRGKKLAYVQTGCNDTGFIDNAMLDSEIPSNFFGARVGEKDLTGANAAVASYKTAQAVFAPVSSAPKGVNKLFDTGNVPNPAFVQLNGSLPSATETKVAAAVLGYGGQGAISGWSKPSRDAYAGLAGQMQAVRKAGVFAGVESPRLDSKDVLVDPPTLKDPALVAVRHLFVRPPGVRME
jgi:hypothetical protein